MKDENLKVAVLFGGESEERDVSAASAARVILALRERGCDVLPIDSHQGFISAAQEVALLNSRVAESLPSDIESGSKPLWPTDVARVLADHPVDLVFLAIHGGAGEDGTIQSLLDLIGVAYSGSGPLGSALAMDKAVAKRVMAAAGINTPRWLTAPVDADTVQAELGFPVIVKPNKQGSTVGLSLVKDPSELEAALAKAFKYDHEVLVEEFIAGREFTVGILGDEALSVGEIALTSDAVFDYAKKYQPGAVREDFPANLPDEATAKLKAAALQAHRALKLDGYSRADFRMDSDGEIWCLEVNTLPGMTRTSLYPELAKAAGIPFPELCERICRLALAKKKAVVKQ